MCYCGHSESSCTANCLQFGHLTGLCYSLHLCNTGLQSNLSDEQHSSLPVGPLIVFTQSTFPNACTRTGMATGSDRLYFSHKMRTLKNTRHLIVVTYHSGVALPPQRLERPWPSYRCLSSFLSTRIENAEKDFVISALSSHTYFISQISCGTSRDYFAARFGCRLSEL